MTRYAEYVKQYVKDELINYPYMEKADLVEAVCAMYREIHYTEMKDQLIMEEEILGSLSRKKRNRLINTVVDICGEREKAAILAGMRTGAQLFLWLNE